MVMVMLSIILLMYGAQNEAYKYLLAENVANDLCFS